MLKIAGKTAFLIFFGFGMGCAYYSGIGKGYKPVERKVEK
jgi:hypothetical protein